MFAFYVCRTGVPKLLVLLTDGSQTNDYDAVDPGDIADNLRKNFGIKLVVIGVGTGVNVTELAHIAGEDSQPYTATNFDELTTPGFIGKISETTCKSSTLIVNTSPYSFDS